jgi:GNAT superfamily N-acetyltransferase
VPDESFQFEQLGSQHNRAGFSCGVEALDRYIHQQAGQDVRRNIALPYVLIESSTSDIVGYYTLSAYSIVPSSLPAAATRRLPHYTNFPATLIGRLAVDRRYQSRGFGRRLLLDALRRCLAASRQVAIMVVVVDAKDDGARSFYERHGFTRFQDHEYRLFLPIDTIAKLGLDDGVRER